MLFSDFWLKHEAFNQTPNMVGGGRLYSYPAPLTPAVGELLETWVVPEMLQNVLVSDVAPE